VGVEPAFARNAPVWPLSLAGRLPEEAPDPCFTLPEGLLVKDARDAIDAEWLKDQNPVLTRAPVDRMAPAALKAAGSVKWRAAVVASLAFHAAVAWLFVNSTRDQMLIAGSENAGITMLGSAAEDQSAAGAEEFDATQVTIINMVEPKPVETIAAEAVPVVEAAAAVSVETVEAVEPVASWPPPPAEQPTVETTLPALPSETPEVLTAETLVPDPSAVAKPEETEAIQTAKAIPAKTAETVREVPEPVETVRETRPETTPAARAEPVAKPKEKPPEKPVKKAEANPVGKKAKKKATPRPDKKAAAKAETSPARKPGRAGSDGAGQADTRRGAADGQANGTTAAKGKTGKGTSPGNAAVTNYPGKVVSKLRRALRYPAQARAKRLKGEVRVAFTVSANGGVGGIHVVVSSGSPILDKAAVDTVRRAAPFPAIPPEAGRSSWPFTVPLAFVR
jgi:protein TonB